MVNLQDVQREEAQRNIMGSGKSDLSCRRRPCCSERDEGVEIQVTHTDQSHPAKPPLQPAFPSTWTVTHFAILDVEEIAL